MVVATWQPFSHSISLQQKELETFKNGNWEFGGFCKMSEEYSKEEESLSGYVY